VFAGLLKIENDVVEGLKKWLSRGDESGIAIGCWVLQSIVSQIVYSIDGAVIRTGAIM